jgi:hypothetical protein
MEFSESVGFIHKEVMLYVGVVRSLLNPQL